MPGVMVPEDMGWSVGLEGNWADNCVIRASGDQDNTTFQGSDIYIDDIGRMSIGSDTAGGMLDVTCIDPGYTGITITGYDDIFDPQEEPLLKITPSVDDGASLDVFKIESTSNFRVDGRGHVGLGTAYSIFGNNIPILAVKYPATNTNLGTPIIDNQIMLHNPSDTNNNFFRIGFFTDCTLLDDSPGAGITAQFTARGNYLSDTDLVFHLADQGIDYREVLRLHHGGGVGINQPAPSATLDIVQHAAAITALEVSGAANRTAPIFQIREGSGTPNDNIFEINSNSGNDGDYGYLNKLKQIYVPGQVKFGSAATVSSGTYLASMYGYALTNSSFGRLTIDYASTNIHLMYANQRIGFNEQSPITAMEFTHADPFFTFHNKTETDAAGGRASGIIARGEDSLGAESMGGYMEFAHDGGNLDEKFYWRLALNRGSDGESPTEVIRALSNGNIGYGITVPTAYIHLKAGTAAAGTAPFKFTPGACLTTPEIGALECTVSGLFYTTLGDRRSLIQGSQPVVSSTTVANTTAETTIYTTNLAADELIEGETITTEVFGVITTHDASPIVTVRVKIGGTTITTVTSTAGFVTDEAWRIKSTFTVRSIGATGTVQAFCAVEFVNENKSSANIATTTVDTTVISDITVTAQWSAALADNTITASQGYSLIDW